MPPSGAGAGYRGGSAWLLAGQIAQQVADVVERVLLAGGDVVRQTRLRHVGVGAAEFLHRHLLAGDRLDDVRPGDEHLAGLVDHDDEVGERGGVDVAARCGAHDQRDLRDDAGGLDVVVEDVAVQAQRDDTLLDAGARAVVDADERPAGLDGQLLHLDDLLAVHLAEAAAEHRRVLAEDADVAAVDGAVAGDHAVAQRPVLGQPEVRAAVLGQRVELDERVLVEQRQGCARGRSACPWRGPSRPPPHRPGAASLRPACADRPASPRWCECPPGVRRTARPCARKR